MPSTITIKGENLLDEARKVEAIETLLQVGSTKQLEKLAKLAKDPKKRALLNLA